VTGRQLLWLFFGFSGRIDRQAFALAGMLLYLARLYPVYRMLLAGNDEAALDYWGNIFITLFGVLIVSHIALAAKRLHDFDRPGWPAIFFLIGDIIAFLILCFPRGTSGPNRYGRRPNAPAGTS
jgi:uncharacterized membrane protein YhaH (DUF805 family)